jgi:hypothetical protein
MAFAWPLNSDTQRSVSTVSGVYHKLSRLIDDAAVKAGTEGDHPSYITFFQTLYNVRLMEQRPAVRDKQKVLSDLSWREIHEKSIFYSYYMRF